VVGVLNYRRKLRNLKQVLTVNILCGRLLSVAGNKRGGAPIKLRTGFVA